MKSIHASAIKPQGDLAGTDLWRSNSTVYDLHSTISLSLYVTIFSFMPVGHFQSLASNIFLIRIGVLYNFITQFSRINYLNHTIGPVFIFKYTMHNHTTGAQCPASIFKYTMHSHTIGTQCPASILAHNALIRVPRFHRSTSQIIHLHHRKTNPVRRTTFLCSNVD